MRSRINSFIRSVANAPSRIAYCENDSVDYLTGNQRFASEYTFAVITPDIPCLILRDSSPPTCIPEEEWATERIRYGNQELFCFSRRTISERWLESHAKDLGGIHRLALLPAHILQNIDPNLIPPEAVAIYLAELHTDLFLFSGSEFLAYFRIPQGLADLTLQGERFLFALHGIAEHWWNETLPDQRPSALVFLGEIPAEIKPLLASACRFPVQEICLNYKEKACLSLLKSEQNRSDAIPDSPASRKISLWFNQQRWQILTSHMLRYLGTSVVAATLILSLVLLVLAGFSISHREALMQYHEQEIYAQKASILRHELRNEQERLARFLSLRSHRASEITAITEAMPADIWLERWSIQGPNHSIFGLSLADSLVPNFQSKLGASSLGIKARLKTTEQAQWNTRPVIRFEMGVTQ